MGRPFLTLALAFPLVALVLSPVLSAENTSDDYYNRGIALYEKGEYGKMTTDYNEAARLIRESRKLDEAKRQAADVSPEALLSQLRHKMPNKSDEGIIQLLRTYAPTDKSLVESGMSWFAKRVQQARRQRDAVIAIKDGSALCNVYYDYQLDSSGKEIRNAERLDPVWLRELVGDDFFVNVVSISVGRDCDMKRLKDLPHVQNLDLFNSYVTDDGLAQLENMTQLKTLRIENAPVTDAGMKYLEPLTQLHTLRLNWLPVTDAGLVHIKKLSQLRDLQLVGSKVSDVGLENLRALPQLEMLFLSDTAITDAGLIHLKGLTHLRWLDLGGTKVTDSGLEHLTGLTEVQTLWLKGTQVTDAGVKKLQQALPKCKIFWH